MKSQCVQKHWFLRCKMIYLFSRCWTSYASRPTTCCWSNFAFGRAIVTWISKRISLFHENISFASTKCSSLTEGCFDEMFFQNGRVQKRAFGLDETLICNLHLGSAARLRRLGRASKNGKVKVVRDFCESVVVFESEFPIMPSGSSVPKQFGSGTIWSSN